MLTFEAKLTKANNLVSIFYTSFTVAFPVIFALEISAATICRLITFKLWEEEGKTNAVVE